MNNIVLSIQDISCFGQCSTTVALPVISACGIECAVLPSALLSTHTAGAFQKTGFTCLDLSAEFSGIEKKWIENGIKFGAVYTGYLGSVSQIDMVKSIMSTCLAEGGLKIVDPAMADGGKLYPAFGTEYVNAMKILCSEADIIIPNISEACFLTDTEYKEEYTEGYIRQLMYRLEALGVNTIIMTGVGLHAGQTGVAVYESGGLKFYEHEKLPVSYHGTGDIYSSVFVGAKMRGLDNYIAASLAAVFTCGCIKSTIGDDSHWYGVKFEPHLSDLGPAISTILNNK